MKIQHLWMQHFRSYTNTVISFSPLTIIVGPNAAGKTNILEALSILSYGKSFRASQDREVISFSSDIARIKGKVLYTSGEDPEVEIVFTRGMVQGAKAPSKKFLINGVSRRVSDHVGTFSSVLFWPQDLVLVTDSPSVRRKYLDQALLLIDAGYHRALTTYDQALRRRNRVLGAIREGMARREELSYWDSLVIEHGQYITGKRAWYIDMLNQVPSPVDDYSFSLIYEKSEISEERLSHYAEAEIASANTLVGPQRDDMVFRIHQKQNVRVLSAYGSRGEQRIGVLWSKVGEATIVARMRAEKPVLLLDDVYSELDVNHRNALAPLIVSHQTIMTTTDLSVIDPETVSRATILHAPLP